VSCEQSLAWQTNCLLLWLDEDCNWEAYYVLRYGLVCCLLFLKGGGNGSSITKIKARPAVNCSNQPSIYSADSLLHSLTSTFLGRCPSLFDQPCPVGQQYLAYRPSKMALMMRVNGSTVVKHGSSRGAVRCAAGRRGCVLQGGHM